LIALPWCLSLPDQVHFTADINPSVLNFFFRILAAFGAEINDPILGYVIPLSSFTTPCLHNNTSPGLDNSGCPDLCITGPNEPTEDWIALVQRGQCEFVKKVREAQRLGAKAVVVGGEDPDISGFPDTLVNMYSPGTASSFIVKQ
jgi:E3 ubiquitin-protein ligase RNF13/E3 ubiquitin-protein ligase RNF167